MAVGTGFKQQCPSCEAMVPVKDAALVGKKIECPKCKDKFIVQSPAKKQPDDEDEAGSAKAVGKTTPTGKKPAPAAAGKKGAPEQKTKPGAKPQKSKAIVEEDDADDA